MNAESEAGQSGTALMEKLTERAADLFMKYVLNQCEFCRKRKIK